MLESTGKGSSFGNKNDFLFNDWNTGKDKNNFLW